MIDEGAIVQRSSGSTGGTPSATFDFGFGNPVRADTYSVLVIAHDVSNLPYPEITGNNFAAWTEFHESNTAYQVANCPYLFVLAAGYPSLSPSWGGDSQWTATYNPANPRSVAWMAFEILGLLPYPNAKDAGVHMSAVAGGGAATSIVMTATAPPGPAARTDNYDYCAFASRVASGTPPTVTAVTPTTSQPGTWVESMPSVATTNASGPNVRLDMWHKSQEDTPGWIDATAAYSGASFLAALVAGLTAQPLVDRPGPISVS